MTIELNEIEQEKAVALAMLKAIDLQIKADKIDRSAENLTDIQLAQIDFYRNGEQFYRQLAEKLKGDKTEFALRVVENYDDTPKGVEEHHKGDFQKWKRKTTSNF